MTGGQWMDRLDQRITDQLGFANRGAVYNIVASALKAGTTEAVDNLQHLQGARLDALQQALWTSAMDGDLPAVTAIVRIIQARCRLYGLIGKTAMPRPTTPRTVRTIRAYAIQTTRAVDS